MTLLGKKVRSCIRTDFLCPDGRASFCHQNQQPRLFERHDPLAGAGGPVLGERGSVSAGGNDRYSHGGLSSAVGAR